MADTLLATQYLSYFKVKDTKEKSINLVISDTLKKVLQKTNSTNKFVKRLLDNIKIKAAYIAEDNANFIDVTIDENGDMMFSYLTPDTLAKNMRKFGFLSPSRFLDERHQIIKESTKPGRILLKIFDKATDKEIEEFATILKTANVSESIVDSFKEVNGDLISYYYNEHSYSKGETEASTLHKSCMRYSQINMFMDLYSKNPDSVSLLILPDEKGKIKGRAILWTKDGKKYIDRIYYQTYGVYTMFVKYCKLKNILNISEKNSSFVTIPDHRTFSIQLQNWLFQYYPYPDSLTWLDIKTGILYADKPETNMKSMRTDIKEFIPNNHHTPAILDNTEALLRYIEREIDSSACSYPEKESVFFHIQSTGGKGNVLKKYTSKKQHLVYLGETYNAYIPKQFARLQLCTEELAPTWDTYEQFILSENGDWNRRIGGYVGGKYKQKFLEKFTYVLGIQLNQDKISYTGYSIYSSPMRNVNPSVVIDKQFAVKSNLFCWPLIKAECVLIDANDPESYVPKIIYDCPYCKIIVDHMYAKSKLDRKNVLNKPTPSADLLFALAKLMFGESALQRAEVTLEKLQKRIAVANVNIIQASENYLHRYMPSDIGNHRSSIGTISAFTKISFLLQNYTSNTDIVGVVPKGSNFSLMTLTSLLPQLPITEEFLDYTIVT